jgi:outer membrane lipoprotein-sorting protein
MRNTSIIRLFFIAAMVFMLGLGSASAAPAAKAAVKEYERGMGFLF